MSTSTTTNLGLVLDNADEPVKTHHQHANANLATLDVTIKSLQDSMENAKALLGQLGIDAEEHYVVDAETARATLGVPSLSDIGNIVRQNIPLMSSTTLGGAKLEEHGGLVLRDESLGIGSLVQESDGTVRGSIAELTAKGHAEQASTTGKNLLPIIAQTRNGMTWTIVDGVLRFSGTAVATYAYYYPQNAEGQSNKLSLNAGTYTISGAINSTSGVVINVQVTLDGTALLPWNSSSGSFTLGSASEVLIYYSIDRLTVGTSYSGTAELQLELGSTATEYEPYTGGAPSPSPEFPQTIEVVRGRNLFGAALNKVLGGSTSSGFALIDGGTSFVARVAKNTTYTIRDYSAQTGNRFRIVGFTDEPSATSTTNSTEIYYDNAANPRQHTFNSGTWNWVVLTVDSQTYYSDAKAQLELGSVATPYVPCGHVGMEVQGKNLLHPVDGSATIRGVTFTTNPDGSVSISGTASGGPAQRIYGTRVKVSAGTYAISGFSGTGSLSSATYLKAIFYDTETSTETPAEANDIGSGGTVTLSTEKWMMWFISIGNGQTINATFYPQLELGSTATEYQPYFEPTCTPIPLPSRGLVGSLPDGTADSLRLDGAGKVEWTLPTAQVVYDGDESWATDGKRIYTALAEAVKPDLATTIANGLCSHFIAHSAGQLSFGDTCGFAFGSSASSRMQFSDGTGSMTVESWVAWLSTHNVTVLYPLATPVTEDCGYCEDWPTDIPEGAVITIPELDNLGIKYFVDSAVTELARQWYARAEATIGQAVVELAARVAVLES